MINLTRRYLSVYFAFKRASSCSKSICLEEFHRKRYPKQLFFFFLELFARSSVSRHRARLPSCQVLLISDVSHTQAIFQTTIASGACKSVLFMAVLTRSSTKLGTHGAHRGSVINWRPSRQSADAGRWRLRSASPAFRRWHTPAIVL